MELQQEHRRALLDALNKSTQEEATLRACLADAASHGDQQNVDAFDIDLYLAIHRSVTIREALVTNNIDY